MAKLTQEMKDMIGSQQCFVATAGKDGLPNVAPKRSTRVYSDEALIFTEGTGGATYRNVLEGKKVAVAVVDRAVPDGYRFICRPEFQSSGEAYEKAKEVSMKTTGKAPLGVVILHVEEIHSLKPGPMAGKKIG